MFHTVEDLKAHVDDRMSLRVHNLSNHLNQPEIPWKLNYYPDGQIQFCFTEEDMATNDKVDPYSTNRSPFWIPNLNSPFCMSNLKRAELKIAITDSIMLDVFYQVVNFCEKLKVELNVTILYWYGSRSDKTESNLEYSTNDLLADFLKYKRLNLRVLYPHGETLCSDHNGSVLDILFNLRKLKGAREKLSQLNGNPDYVSQTPCLIFPDKSALARDEKIDKKFLQYPYIVLDKIREGDKVVSSLSVESANFLIENGFESFVVIDDIIDGGRTFSNVIRLLNENDVYPGRIDLMAHHAVFSGNWTHNLSGYSNIYVTNSVSKSLCDKVNKSSKVLDKYDTQVHIADVWV